MIYPVFLSGFKGGEVRNKKKGSSPSLKSRYRQGIPFLTQVFPELEKSLRTGDIISCLGYPLPEGEIRSYRGGRLAADSQRASYLQRKKEFRYRRIYLEKCRPQKSRKSRAPSLIFKAGSEEQVQKLDLNKSSSLKKQDFQEQVRDNPEFSKIHRREFPIPRLLCRKTRKK